MISKISNQITQSLLKKNLILDEEKELYNYGLFMLISYIVFLLISILFGVIFNITFESMLFYISFCLVRNFAGGIHANTEIKCDVFTTISIFMSVMLIKFLIDYKFLIIALVIQIISFVCLCSIKPVDTYQKQISQEEKLFFHRKVITIVMFILSLSVVGSIIKVYSVVIAFSVSLLLSTILLIMGKMQFYIQKLNCSTTNISSIMSKR